MSSNKKGGDERFLRVQKDSRFWEISEKYTVDKRGRPINQTSTEGLKRFYNFSSSEDEDYDEEGVKSKKEKLVKIEVKLEKEVKKGKAVKSKDIKAKGPPPERGVRVIEEGE